MSIRKASILALASAAALGVAGTANAATYITPPTASTVGTYGNTSPASRFTDVFSFSVPKTGYLTVTLFSVFSSFDQNVNFFINGVKLNGQNFTILNRGNPESQAITVGVQKGVQNLSIQGASGPNGSYSGVLSLAAGPIPEPTTWMLLILGFGAVGYAMRRKNQVRTTVSYA